MLFFLHTFENLGGTEEHTKLLSRLLARNFNCFVAHAEKDEVLLRRVVLSESADATVDFVVKQRHIVPRMSYPVATYRSAPHEKALMSILDEVNPNLIHVQHALNWHLGLLDHLLERNKPTILSIHDYFYLTPHFTMQGSDPSETLTQNYSLRTFGEDYSYYLGERRKVFVSSLGRISRIVCPSNIVMTIYKRFFEGAYQVVGHGIEPFEKIVKSTATGCRFGYFGSLIPQKGFQYLFEAFKRARKQQPDISLAVYGGGRPPEGELAGVTFHGAYTKDRLADIMSSIDIGVIPSIFAETFSLVLSELWFAKKPVIASSIGSLAERIADGENGRLVKPADIVALSEVMLYFAKSDDWKGWSLPQVKLADQMATEYEKLYLELV